VRGLQDASVSGATRLPIRDIPMTTDGVVADPKAQPNHIPAARQEDYISAAAPDRRVRFQEPPAPSSEAMYEELYLPALIAILFFSFQLPATRDIIYRCAPSMCTGDKSYTTVGSAVISITVGALIYAMCKGLGLGM
jgi:hypothetical protein